MTRFDDRTHRSQSIDLLDELVYDRLLLFELAFASRQGVVDFLGSGCKLLIDIGLGGVNEHNGLLKRLWFQLRFRSRREGLGDEGTPSLGQVAGRHCGHRQALRQAIPLCTRKGVKGFLLLLGSEPSGLFPRTVRNLYALEMKQGLQT